jgi:outer membrane protein
MYKLFTTLALSAGLLFTGAAVADYRIATVDVNRVLNESKEAKEKKKTLDDVTLKAKAKIESERKTLKTTEEKLKKDNIKPDSKEADKFRQDAREFARMVKDTDDDLKQRYLKINKDLTDAALAAIRSYAEGKKIDLVLDKGKDARGPVLFGDTSADITEDVIKSMNK